jgi:hypothetical protein
MGFIYTGFKQDVRGVFKIGLCENEETPISRLYANKICDTGCIKIPNANKSTLRLLESVARYALENEAQLSYWNKRDDFFTFEQKTLNRYEGVVRLANIALNAVIAECEYRNIAYEICLDGYTMAGKMIKYFGEDGMPSF